MSGARNQFFRVALFTEIPHGDWWLQVISGFYAIMNNYRNSFHGSYFQPPIRSPDTAFNAMLAQPAINELESLAPPPLRGGWSGGHGGAAPF